MMEKINSPIALLFAGTPKNTEEAARHGNALTKFFNIQAGTDECFNVGISGGCGQSCFVFKRGECPEPDGII